jgi:hypothetical protein
MIVNLVVCWFGFLLLADIYRIKIIRIIVQLSVPLQIYKILHVVKVRQGGLKCFRNQKMKYVLLCGIKIIMHGFT